MQWVVEVGLSNAFAAVLVAMVAWLAGKILRRPAVTHALWLLVLVKLLTPPIFELPLPFSIVRTPALHPEILAARPQTFDQFTSRELNATRERAAMTPQPMPHDTIRPVTSGIDADLPLVSTAPPPDVSAAPVSTASHAREKANRKATVISAHHTQTQTTSWVGLRQLLTILWLTGIVAWVALEFALGLRLRAMLRASTPAPADLSQTAAQIARRMGLRKCPEIRIVAGAGSPMLYGLGYRVRILMPAVLLRRLGPDAQATVLAHELAHYWRGDQWVRLVEVVATALYWWLPIVWWARHRIEIAEEQCCDARVIEICAGNTRVYAEALLDIVDLISEPARRMRPALSSSIGNRPMLQERLVDLMRRRCAPTMTPIARRVVVVAGAVCLSCHPTLFVTEAPAVRAATTNNSTELLRPVVQESQRLLNSPKLALHETPQTTTPQQSPQDLPLPQPAEAVDAEWATAISPNGRYHITVRRGYECELREVTGADVKSLAGHRITCVAFAPDSARFVTGDLNGTVQLWDAASGEVLQTLAQQAGPVYSVCLAPSSNRAVAAGEDGVVELVSLESPSDRHVFARLESPVRCARFSRDGSRLAVVTDTWRTTAAGTVAVFDVATRARLLQWTTPGPLGAVDFTSDDGLVTIEWSGRVREWSLPALHSENLQAIAKELVSAASFSVDTRVLEDLERNTEDSF